MRQVLQNIKRKNSVFLKVREMEKIFNITKEKKLNVKIDLQLGDQLFFATTTI